MSNHINISYKGRVVARVFPLKKGGFTVDLSPYRQARAGGFTLGGLDQLDHKYGGSNFKVSPNFTVEDIEKHLLRYAHGEFLPGCPSVAEVDPSGPVIHRCVRCDGTGFVTLRSGKSGKCFRCVGKGYRSDIDLRRNRRYDQAHRNGKLLEDQITEQSDMFN